jgi:hypothetical protein
MMPPRSVSIASKSLAAHPGMRTVSGLRKNSESKEAARAPTLLAAPNPRLVEGMRQPSSPIRSISPAGGGFVEPESTTIASNGSPSTDGGIVGRSPSRKSQESCVTITKDTPRARAAPRSAGSRDPFIGLCGTMPPTG